MDQYNLLMQTGISIAKNGVDQFNDTDSHSGKWKCFTTQTETEITSLTEEGYDARLGTSTVLTTIPAFTYVSACGYFTEITLASGTVTMVRAVD